MATELQSPPTRRSPARLSGNITDAVLVATAPGDDGGPAAALPFEAGTLLGRLVAQFLDIGVPHAHVITRPEWEDAVRGAVEAAGGGATVYVADGLAADL